MKFDDYKNMKNFSEQQNFAAPAWLQKFINPETMAAVKAKGASAWDALKAVPSKVKNVADKAWNPAKNKSALTQLNETIEDATLAAAKDAGVANKLTLSNAAKDKINTYSNRAAIVAAPLALGAKAVSKLHGDKTLKGAEGVFQKIGSKFTEGKGFFGSTRAAQQAKLGKMIAGGAGVGALGTGATIYALADSGVVDPAKYYIFDGESGKPLSDGFATKDEALAVRNQNFPGARINRGNTLMQKAG